MSQKTPYDELMLSELTPREFDAAIKEMFEVHGRAYSALPEGTQKVYVRSPYNIQYDLKSDLFYAIHWEDAKPTMITSFTKSEWHYAVERHRS